MDPVDQRPPLNHCVGWRELTAIRLALPRRESLSPELQKVQAIGLIGIEEGDHYHLEVSFDAEEEHRREAYLTPELPLTLGR